MANITWFEIRRIHQSGAPAGTMLTQEKPLRYSEALDLADEFDDGEGVSIWMMTFSGSSGRISGAVVHTIKPSEAQEAA